MFKKIAAILLSLTLLLTLAACDSVDYDKAMDLYEQGAYEEALELFLELGDYEDSAEMVNACDYAIAGEQYEEGEYAKARETFLALGDYEDSAEMAKRCDLGEAAVLMENGNFDEAEKLLAGLGDFEEAPELLKEIPFRKVAKWLSDEGKQVYTGPEGYTVEMSTNGDSIAVSYIFDQASSGVELYINYTIELNAGQTEVLLNAEGKMIILTGKLQDTCQTTLDIAAYTRGYEVTDWDKCEITGNKVDGSPLDSSASGVAETISDVSLTRLTDGMNTLLGDSGLGVTMADMGFTSYK